MFQVEILQEWQEREYNLCIICKRRTPEIGQYGWKPGIAMSRLLEPRVGL